MERQDLSLAENDRQNENSTEPPIDESYDPALENIRNPNRGKELLRNAPSIVFSLAVHGVALLLLGICYLPTLVDFRSDLTAQIEEIEDIELIDVLDERIELNTDLPDEFVSINEEWAELTSPEIPEPQAMQVATLPSTDGMFPDVSVSIMGEQNAGGLGDRANNRSRLGPGSGMNEDSERAVAMALAWIADHQLPNGAWAYTQAVCPNCRGKCKDTPLDKANKSLISGTAMALLPMLGSGITHKEGKYRKNVKAGLDYITNNLKLKPEGVCFADVDSYQLYHQGLTTIVVCEAAAMTRDKNLEKLAQGAIRYIAWAQDPVGGGWRYTPRQPGDTSGMGWNFMALKSAQMAYLDVPAKTIRGSKHFLDNVAGAEGGAKYGYLNNRTEDGEGLRRDQRALTAIGLLGQMYMGWGKEHPPLVRGTDYLAQWGPDLNNLYYTYYATQVMRHVGGEKWETWNKKTRDELVKRQVREGHEKGSWYTTGGHMESAGRLGSTAFATMILEVYYRHLPLYGSASTVEAFPLD